MKVKEFFHNIKCDVCGVLADEEIWHADENTVGSIAQESNWHFTDDEKHYCPDCWEYGDNDEIIIKLNKG